MTKKIKVWGRLTSANVKKVLTPLDYLLAITGTWNDAP